MENALTVTISGKQKKTRQVILVFFRFYVKTILKM